MSGVRITRVEPRCAPAKRTDPSTRRDARAWAATTRVQRNAARSGRARAISADDLKAGLMNASWEAVFERGLWAFSFSTAAPSTRASSGAAGASMPSKKKSDAPLPPAPPPPSPPSPLSPPVAATLQDPASFDASVLDDGGEFTLRASLTVYASQSSLPGLAPQWTDASVRTARSLQPRGPRRRTHSWVFRNLCRFLEFVRLSPCPRPSPRG